MKRSICVASLLLPLLSLACGDATASDTSGSKSDSPSGSAAISAPLQHPIGGAYEAALRVDLPERAPEEDTGLHNLYQLSDNILSGAEPDNEIALRLLSERGIKTILSVDGKAPDAETAAKYGMTYVHVPIQYRGLSTEETLQITKTFREQEGPFYVHCFHGKHRGPAAAALGRVALDGVPREQAIAEMRQWCGTSPKYEGLYATISQGVIPSATDTEGYEFDFPSALPLDGFAGYMVEISRPYDRIKEMAKRKWQVNPDHPDLDPVNEAAVLALLLERAPELEELADYDDQFRTWMAESVPQSKTLHESLVTARETGDWTAAEAALDQLSANCNACHKAHRN
ncbi:MAG: hypothetical protein DHS20C15_26700 [Planctomycetota bacterium]|nr:MAG: hypothetical protein DHS20C15_26700 [Planctomycetota bacterium]